MWLNQKQTIVLVLISCVSATCSPELLGGERLDEGEDGVVDAGQQLQEHPVREAKAGDGYDLHMMFEDSLERGQQKADVVGCL